MDSFDKRKWSPSGSRPHIEIPASPAVAELAAAYIAQAAAWCTEQDDPREFDAIARPVAPQFLHLTVGWLDQLTATLAPGEFDKLHAVLTDRLADLAPFEVTVGPGIVGAVALELYVVPTPPAAALAAAVRGSIRDVFGADAAPEPPPTRPWRPHITAFYGTAPVNTDGLASRILYTLTPDKADLITPVPMAVDAVLLVDQDTWGPDGLAWDQQTARRIPLGAA